MHLFTALGAGLGFWSLILIFNGAYQQALWVLAAAAVIDSVDGTLARRFDIEFHAANIDGELLDNIIDYLNWSIAPLFWAYMTMSIPLWVVILCAVASVLGFSNTQAKTEDHYFRGFPNYWNIVVLYLYLLNFDILWASIVLLICAVGVFLPIKYIYPSRTEFGRPLTLVLGSIYILQIVPMLYLLESTPQWLLYSSLVFPAYYFLLSFYLNFREAP